MNVCGCHLVYLAAPGNCYLQCWTTAIGTREEPLWVRTRRRSVLAVWTSLASVDIFPLPTPHPESVNITLIIKNLITQLLNYSITFTRICCDCLFLIMTNRQRFCESLAQKPPIKWPSSAESQGSAPLYSTSKTGPGLSRPTKESKLRNCCFQPWKQDSWRSQRILEIGNWKKLCSNRAKKDWPRNHSWSDV